MMLRTTYAKRPQGDYCDYHRGKPSPIRWAGLAGLVLVPDALKAPSAVGVPVLGLTVFFEAGNAVGRLNEWTEPAGRIEVGNFSLSDLLRKFLRRR